MPEVQRFYLVSPGVRQNAAQAVRNAPEGWVVEIKPRTRTIAQNSRMWAMLTDISRQVDWYGQKLTPDEWKDVFTAALKRQNVVHGVDGGFVVIGARTSKMTIREMGDLMELMSAFGAERGVQFTEAFDDLL